MSRSNANALAESSADLDWLDKEPHFIPRERVAKLFGDVSLRTVDRWVAKGDLKKGTFGGRTLITRDSVRAFAARGLAAG